MASQEYSRPSGLLRTVSSFKNLTSLSRSRNTNGEAHPGFLPMVPWYCGTSADLVKVFIDLAVSLKLFLGRFDMRTMQAATSPSWCGQPHHGDGFTYEQFDDHKELFFDFCADTGDGGNSTYTVARALAAPVLTATHRAPNGTQKTTTLPRANLLLIGGDLAYPGPSQETYEQRLFRPFQAALPGPPHDVPGRLLVHKPDLPQGEHWSKDSPHQSSTSPSHSGLQQLRQYDGPQCFAIPGNHDWSDGLQTFMRDILHRGWLGGWLLPQEKSYFALKLPHAWWMFGVDLALECDIDMCQYRYFTRVIEQCLGDDSQVIVMSHQPIWFENWFMCQPERAAPNLKQLIREQLHGRARVHLAGDLHFFMRHSLVPVKTDCHSDVQNVQNGCSRVDAMLSGTSSPREKQTGKGKDSVNGINGKGVTRQPAINGYGHQWMAENGRSKSRNGTVQRVSLSENISGNSVEGLAKDSLATSGGDAAVKCKSSRADTTSLPNCLDPEHLIVNGLGGAFLHPVHVFCGASFEGQLDSSVRSQGSGINSKRRSADLGTTASSSGDDSGAAPQLGGYRGEYQCQAAYPPPPQSVRLGRDNLFRFRWKNTRFDVVGALWYFLLVYSVIPRCSVVASILEAPNFLEASNQFLLSFLDMLHAIVSESYVSLSAMLVMLAVNYCFTIKGGIGVAQSSPQWSLPGAGDHWLRGFRGPLKGPAERGFRVRTGGPGMQFLFASMHTMAHLSVAVILMLVLEMGVVTCIRYESVGQEGYHSLYSWFVSSLDTHFPDPMGLRSTLEKTTLGMYPMVLKYMMTIFDIPEVVAVAHMDICKNGSWESLTRLQTLGYILGVLAYYWVLAAPAMGLVLGVYFYVCCQFFNVHYDEAFSALRIQNHKGFSRLHITPAGDLEIYTLAADAVPRAWREDPAWRGPEGGGNARGGPSHRAKRPSRWLPRWEACEEGCGEAPGDGVEFRVVDYVFVPRRRGGEALGAHP